MRQGSCRGGAEAVENQVEIAAPQVRGGLGGGGGCQTGGADQADHVLARDVGTEGAAEAGPPAEEFGGCREAGTPSEDLRGAAYDSGGRMPEGAVTSMH